MSRKKPVLVNTDLYRTRLLEQRVPFTATKIEKFYPDDYIKKIDHTDADDNRNTTLSVSQQLEMWHASIEPITDETPRGWTLCITGKHDIARADAMAAFIMGRSMEEGLYSKWVSLTSGYTSDKWLREVMGGANPTNVLGCLVVSGLRWDSNSSRFDKAFDLMRMAPDSCNKIVTGVGENPIGTMRAMGLPCTRFISLRNYQEKNVG